MHHLIDSLLHILALINMSAMIFPFLLEIKGGSLKRLQSSYRLFAGGGGGFRFSIKASFIVDTKGWYCVTKGNISGRSPFV